MPEGVEGGEEEGSLAGEGFQRSVAGAAEDGAAGEILHQAEAALRRGWREGGHDNGVMFVEGVEESGELGRRGSEVRVG